MTAQVINKITGMPVIDVKAEDTRKAIQKEYKCFRQDIRTKYFLVDVYCDRVNFVVGYQQWLVVFFENRGIIADCDRGGISINTKDAILCGLPTEVGTYRVPVDARKAWLKQ